MCAVSPLLRLHQTPSSVDVIRARCLDTERFPQHATNNVQISYFNFLPRSLHCGAHSTLTDPCVHDGISLILWMVSNDPATTRMPFYGVEKGVDHGVLEVTVGKFEVSPFFHGL